MMDLWVLSVTFWKTETHTGKKNGVSSAIHQTENRKLSCYSDIKLNSHLHFTNHQSENDHLSQTWNKHIKSCQNKLRKWQDCDVQPGLERSKYAQRLLFFFWNGKLLFCPCSEWNIQTKVSVNSMFDFSGPPWTSLIHRLGTSTRQINDDCNRCSVK